VLNAENILQKSVVYEVYQGRCWVEKEEKKKKKKRRRTTY
jgi:hypothetical protein